MFSKRHMYLAVTALLLALLVLGGCAKKKVSGPEDTTGGMEPVQTMTGDEGKAGGMDGHAATGGSQQGADEFGLSAEEKARQEAERQSAEKQALIDKVSMDVDDPVYFAFDSFELSQTAQDKLQQKANVLKEYQELNLVIEGHCDERGTEEYNLALGERRARAAYEYLILLGIDSGRMQIVSYGEERPAVPESNEAAWAKNRRCEFKVY